MEWQLAEAKNKLSEVMRRAIEEGPQRITRRGEAVVMLSEDAYRQLTGDKPSLARYLLDAPSLQDVDLARNKSGIRLSDL